MEKKIYEEPAAKVSIPNSIDIICDSGKTELPEMEF